MTTNVTAQTVNTFSEFKKISQTNILNKKLGIISERNDALNGSGVLFSPLPGFYFGHCGPLKINSTIHQCLYYDEPVFVAALVLEGSCDYQNHVQGSAPLSLKKNMLLAGYWEDLNIETIIPKQKSYSHLGFFFTKTALEKYFGKNTTSQLHKLINSKNSTFNTVIGHATSNTILRVQESFATTEDITTSDLLTLRGNALNCFVALVSNISSFNSPKTTYPPHQMDVQKIASLKDYIDKNFLTIEKVTALCSEFGMSFSKANSLFKSLYLLTISQYIHDCKMTYAYSNLVTQKYNVTECAIEVGYSNISHFISSFKKRYNVTPKAVTKLHTTNSILD